MPDASDINPEQIERFLRELGQLRGRVEGTRERSVKARATRAMESPDQRDVALQDAETELSVTVEKLSIAGEELRQQNETLLSLQSELQAERDRYYQLFALAPDPIIVTDLAGLILATNAAAVGTLAGIAGRPLRKPLATFIELEHRRAFRTFVDLVSTSRDLSHGDLLMRGRDGRTMTMAVTAVRHLNPRTRRPELIWAFRDVTAQREFERRISTWNAELERRVEERTNQLLKLAAEKDEIITTTRALAEQLETALTARDQFFSVLSHEFRTPLQALFGYTELLLEGLHGPLTPQQAEDIRRIQRSQSHLLVLVNSILDFARINSAQPVTLELARVPLREVFTMLTDIVLGLTSAKQVTVEHVCDPPEISAYGDRGKVQQILLNLLSNAIRFSPPGGRITLFARIQGEQTLISVSDTGQGIPPDKLEAVFEPFLQLAKPAGEPSTGLGLAISRSLAEAMGGTLIAKSELGNGTTFELRLPAGPGLL
jgi:PAS domain S-box-containing protein